MSEYPVGEGHEPPRETEAAGAARADGPAPSRRPEDLDPGEIAASLDLYDREFDTLTAQRFEERYAEQERQARYAQAAEPHNANTAAGGSRNEPFGGLFGPAPAPDRRLDGLLHGATLNPWGYMGILGALLMPILGLAFGYLGIRKARETGAGLLPSKIALALATFTVAMNFYLYMNGGLASLLQTG